MITYLIKFVVCSGLLLLVYRVLLANDKMLRFNRAYLLLSLMFSMAVPFIPIVTHRPAEPVVYQQDADDVSNGEPTQRPIPATRQNIDEVGLITAHRDVITPVAPINYWPMVLWSVYGLVTMLLLGRFALNLWRISVAIRKGETVAHNDVTLVLTDNDVNPHSFFKYLFIGRGRYQQGGIEPEIICHESAHARQWHSVDILLIELLQAFCWFNPAIPFYKQAIQLNHEFLADDAVTQNQYDTPAYQLLLLAKAGQNNNLQLASQFNYLTTKKRLVMMTRNTSPKVALAKQLAMVPVIAATVLLFSHKVVAMDGPVKDFYSIKPDVFDKIRSRHFWISGGHITASQVDAPKRILDEYAAIVKRYITDTDEVKKHPRISFSPEIKDADESRLNTLYKQMSRDQQHAQFVTFVALPKMLAKNPPSQAQLDTWKNGNNYGVFINSKLIKNSALAKYKAEDFALYRTDTMGTDEAKEIHFTSMVDLMTKRFYSAYTKIPRPKHDDQMIHRVSERARDNDATPDMQYTEMATYPSSPQDAPQSILDAYLAIEKKYKTYKSVATVGPAKGKIMLGAPYVADSDDVKLRALFVQMSKKQQRQQIIYYFPYIIFPKILAAEKDINNWKNNSSFGIWVDDKRIKNSQIDQYKATGLILVFNSPLSQIAVKNDGFRRQLTLMTPQYYDRYVKQLEEANKTGGRRVLNFKILTQNKALMDEFTTDEKPTYVPKQVLNAQGEKGVSNTIQTIPDIDKGLPSNGLYSAPLEAATQDAPASVLHEYAAIIKKYNVVKTPGLSGTVVFEPAFKDEDKARLVSLYQQMSTRQQKAQLVRFMHQPVAPAIHTPNKNQLDTWRNDMEYGVWIDGKRVKNNTLSQYKPEDFDLACFENINLPSDAERFGHKYEIELMTKSYYTHYKQVFEEKKGIVTIYGKNLVTDEKPANVPKQVVDAKRKQPGISYEVKWNGANIWALWQKPVKGC